MSTINASGNVLWGDGVNHGTVIGGGNGGDIYVGRDAEKPQPYGRRRVLLLPITERGLQVASAIATLTVFLTGYQTISQTWSNLQNVSNAAPSFTTLGWLYALMTSLLATALLFTGLRVAHNRTHHYSRLSFLPGLAGVRDGHGTRRLALVRNHGICSTCGGRLRFYAKITASHREYDEGAKKWRTVVDAREPVAACVRNPKRHCWLLDPADTDDLDFCAE